MIIVIFIDLSNSLKWDLCSVLWNLSTSKHASNRLNYLFMKAKCEAILIKNSYKEFWTVQEVIYHKPSIITITLLLLTMRV